MNILSIENLSKSFQEKPLFQNIQIGISQGEKIGLIGVNGAGKSTLLKLIMGEESPETGKVAIRNGAKVGFLKQEPEFAPHLTVWEAIFDSNNPTLQAVTAYDKALTTGENLEEAMSLMNELDAWNIEYKIKEILGKLGIHDTSAKVQTLSGGQRKRIALAQALLREPDLLVLDEPTNHLDLNVIEWLENYLATSTLTLLLVSHDRYFLDRVTDVIWEIDQQQIFRYEGNYAYFLEARQIRLENQQLEAEKARKLFNKELEWLRRQPKARGTKAKYRIDAAEVLRQKSLNTVEERSFEIGLQAQKQSKKVLEIEHLTKNFGTKKILQDFSYIFKRGEKIGIVGDNGVGKSTFLNLLTGEIPPDTGKVNKGENTIFGYYTQNALPIASDKRVIDVVKEIAEFIDLGNGQQLSISQFLTNFMFSPSKQYDYVAKLSGGERRRLQLLLVLAKNPNFLILDEPTNDLDIFTLTALEQYLADFPGCLLIVSHDRYFMDRLAEHLFVFEGNGIVRDFNGSYSEYRLSAEKEKTSTTNNISKKTEQATEVIKPQNPKKAGFKEKQEFNLLEKEIIDLENRKQQLISQLSQPAIAHQERITVAKEMESLEKELEAKTLRWLELAEMTGIS